MTALVPFRISIDDDRLALLEQRLDSGVWPNVPNCIPGHGVGVERVRDLAQHWCQKFDWREFEAGLNKFTQVLHYDGEYPMHLVHQRTPESTGVPIVLLHGWPDAFLRYRKLIPLLTAAGHDVIVPSLPGFAFSGQSEQPHTTAGAAERVHAALGALGVTRYALHGGDFGSVVADEMVELYPEEIVAIHITDVPFTKHFTVDRSTFSPAERQFIVENDEWSASATYFIVQAAEPLTLSYRLTDSPIGLLAWFADKFDAWSDTVDADDVVGLTAMTWLTGTAWSSMRLYGNSADQEWGDDSPGQNERHPIPGIPAAFSIFPRDIARPPREYCERFYDVVDFRLHDSGGHFAATERPGTLAADITAFLASVD